MCGCGCVFNELINVNQLEQCLAHNNNQENKILLLCSKSLAQSVFVRDLTPTFSTSRAVESKCVVVLRVSPLSDASRRKGRPDGRVDAGYL